MFLQFQIVEAYLNIFVQELEEDYRQFLDYTDGMFHSDYMMQFSMVLKQNIPLKEVFDK